MGRPKVIAIQARQASKFRDVAHQGLFQKCSPVSGSWPHSHIFNRIKKIMINATENKKVMHEIFSALSKGNFQPLFDAMADDMQWTWMGTMRWSKTFNGKQSVVIELFGAVKTTLVEPYKDTAHRFIAEGDCVVVEHSGQNTTADGRPYNNKYCWVCTFAEGKLHSVHEYMDTELVTAAFPANGKS